MLKKLKNKKIVLISVIFLFLLLGGIGAFLLNMQRTKPVEIEETLVESELYWNADREKYFPRVGDITMRKPESDGIYTVRFMVKGELVEYRVKDKKLMIDIDQRSIMGLIVDEDGFITEAVDLERMGVREVAKSCYVQEIEENVAKVNTSAEGYGVEISLTLKEGIGIWNVTSPEHLGTTTKLQTLDCVRAFNSPEGGISDIFVITREDDLTGVPIEKYCEHCKQVVKWRMWIAEDTLPSEEGHWRLIRDIEMQKQHSMEADLEQIIDLNGRTVTATHKNRMISLHNEGCKLSIMDLSEGQKGTLKGLGDGGFGSIVWVRYNGEFNLYSGILDASENVSSGSGTAINVQHKEGVFNMYGGTIIGGTSQAQVVKNEETGKESFRDGTAGAISVKGTVNMYGGTIRDGKVISCKDSKGNIAEVAGGNIFMLAESVFNMYGGVISGGQIPEGANIGGNIRVAKNAVFNMYGGTIENGACLAQGGNIGLYGTLNMSGGTIRNGKVMTGDTLKKATYNNDSLSHNIFCVNGTLNMTGGLIEGYVRILDNGTKADGTPNQCTIKISGTAQIKGGKHNLCLNTGDVVDFGTLKKGAAIYINGAGYVSNETVASNREYVHSDYGVEVLYESKKLLIGKISCVCGQNHINENGKVVKEHFGACDGTVEMWMPWTNNTQLPTTAGNWYLISDVKPVRQFTVAKDTKLKLDLNGYRIYGLEDTRVYSLRNDNVEMILTDLSEKVDGKIVASGDGEGIGYGNCIWVSGKSNLIMYNGTLDASKVDCTVDGVAVAVSKNCSFTMYGGVIKGGKTQTVGGAVSVSGKFDMWDGAIQNGYSKTDGGNIYVLADAQFNMYDGKVTLGEAKACGGNIAGRGHINIQGGEISYGLAEAGGNIVSYKNMTMSGGLLKHGVATVGGNVFITMDSKLVMSGGTMSQGVAQTGTGGNLRSIVGCTIEITGGLIEKGIAETDGGNIWMNGGLLKVTGGTIKEGRALQGTGGNISTDKVKQGGVEENTVLNLAGGLIQGGCAKTKGGNVYAKQAKLTLSGAVTVKDGTAGTERQVSNLYLPSGVTAKINGLTSSDASIGITCEDTIFATNASADKSDIARFFVDDETTIAQTKENELFVGKLNCMCGGHRDDHSTTVNDGHEDWCTANMRDVEWHAWRKDNVLPSDADKFYYLTKDVNLSAQIQLSAEGNYGLDLNGHEIIQTSNSARIYAIWNTAKDITLNITDTSVGRQGSLGFKEGLDVAYNGALIWMRNYSGDVEHTVNLYAGILNGEHINAASLYVDKGNLSVFGGTIEGEVLLTATNGAKLNVSGSPKVGVQVSENKSQKHGVAWAGTLTITGDGVTKEAEIVLPDVLNLTVTGTGEGSAFKVVQHRNQVQDDNNDGIGNLNIAAKMCVCGESDGQFNHTASCVQPAQPWQSWNAAVSIAHDKANGMSGRVFLPSTTGSYYLTEDIKDIKTYAGIVNGTTINLDLAGFTAEGPGGENFMYRLNGGTLNIADSSEAKTGAIISTGAATNIYGRVIWIWGNSSSTSCVNLFSGKLAAADGATGMDGVVVKILNGTFNMYGGEITPGTCTDSNGSNCITVGDGTKNSVLNVQGGTIKGEITLNSASAKVSIGGDAKVGIEQNGKAYGIGTASAVTSAVNVTCKDVTAEGKVVLKDTDYLGVTGTGDERAFTIIDPHNKVVDNSNGDGIGTLSIVARMCVCGAVGEHTQVGGCGAVSAEAWKPWNSAISIAKDKANGMSGRVMLPATTGKYYLTENMSLTTQTAITGSNAVHLDLAGYAATMSSNNNIYRMQGGTLDIADSSANKTGKLESLYTGGDNAGYVIILQSSSTVKIYNVKLMAKSAQKLADTWGLVVARNAGNFAMYGGSIEGNPSSGASSIRATNTSNMYAGINLKDVSLDGVITNKTNW